jgi:site-specific recombinase XerD
MPQNRLILEVSLATGLRLSDVLALKTQNLVPKPTIQEQKTGKKKRVYFPEELLNRMIAQSGSIYVFEHRHDRKKHKTRQAVWKDLNRSMEYFRIPKKLVVSPHTCRKVYAVEQFKRKGDLKKVQELLNHSSEGVTVIYAMADIMTERKLKGTKYSVLKR